MPRPTPDPASLPGLFARPADTAEAGTRPPAAVRPCPLTPESGDLPLPSDPRLRRAFDWWRGLVAAAASGAALPDRRQIEPALITDLLPYAILWDVIEPATMMPGAMMPGDGGARQYRCRLSGTQLEEIRGRNCTGLGPEEIYGVGAAPMRLLFDHTVELARPVCSRHDMSWAGKGFFRYQRLLLPFTHQARLPAGADPARVGLLFGVVSFVME